MLKCKVCGKEITDDYNEYAYKKAESGLCLDCFEDKFKCTPESYHGNTLDDNRYHRNLAFRDSQR